LFVLPVDGRNNLIGVHEIYRGTATGTSVRISEIISSCLLAQGVGLVLVHNHPSGDSQASDEDVRLTADVFKACKLMDIEMLDHLVIGKNSFTSIRSQNPNIWGPSLEGEE
jgi:DNA repair protein RadC